MAAVATIQVNGTNASGYARVGQAMTVNLTGYHTTDAVTVVWSGPLGASSTQLGTLSGGNLNMNAGGSVTASHEGIWSVTATDATGNTDSDTVEVFRTSP
jgi:hypothetical protein